MLSIYPGELARRSTSACLSCSALTKTSQALLAVVKPAGVHQRKHSSSKASNASKDDSRAIAGTTKTSTEPKEATLSSKTHSSTAPRTRRRKLKETTHGIPLKDSEFAHLNFPRVPSTQGIHPPDVHLASFFSQHRPISVSHVIPPTTSAEAFSSLFSPASSSSKSRTEDVIETLSFTVDTLDQAAARQKEQKAPQDLDLRTPVTQSSSPNIECRDAQDNQVHIKPITLELQELAKSFRPFMPPPPPVPLSASPEAKDKSATQRHDKKSSPKHTTYTSTLTVYETSQPDGKKTYKTFATPIVRAPSPSSTLTIGPQKYVVVREDDLSRQDNPYPGEGFEMSEAPSPAQRQPFLRRLKERQMRSYTRSDIIQAISVKRQRKLKMKKHKHKKLLKRTRHLRKKLEK